MESKALKVGWIVMLIMGIYVIMLGLSYLFGSEALTAPEFTSYTGESWSDFADANSKVAAYMMSSVKTTAIFVLVTGFFATLIAWKSFRKAEKWSWYTLLVGGILAWGNVLWSQTLTGVSVGTMVPMIVGTVLFVIGIVIPAKAILSKKST